MKKEDWDAWAKTYPTEDDKKRYIETFKTESMKVNELRVGNWYYSVKWGQAVQCDLSDLYDLCAKSDGAYNDPPIDDMFDPILLTEEWLVKFGFEKRSGNNICWDLGDFMIGWYGNKYATWRIEYLSNERTSEIYSHIDAVHELQDIYSLLTGEELTITK